MTIVLTFSLEQGFTRRKAPSKRKAPPTGAFSSVPDFNPTERNDCSVRAMAIATGIPYAEAHAALQQAGRRKGQGCSALVLARALKLGISWAGAPRPTYAQWLKEHRQGVYIVFVTGHFTAVVNGMQIDTGASLYKPRARVIGHWLVQKG